MKSDSLNSMPQNWEELCADEAICYIACRHHCKPIEVVRQCLESKQPEGSCLTLERNETEIVRGLAAACEVRRNTSNTRNNNHPSKSIT